MANARLTDSMSLDAPIAAPFGERAGAGPGAGGSNTLPSREALPPVDPALFDRAREAVSAIRGKGRTTGGQAGPGNTLAVRHGLRSTQLLEQLDIAAWHREQVAAITADRGGESELSALERASVREVARLEVILGALGDELVTGGVLTGKGKCRSATAVYLQVLDRFVRLSTSLGLERRAKPVGLGDFVNGR